MKLRVKGNAVRLRLTRPEVARLHDAGLVEESAEFGPDQVLVYRVRAAGDSGPVRAEFRAGTVEVTIPCDSVRAWAVSDDVAIEGQSGAMQILVEKDFRCLSRPESEQPDAYPNPAEARHRADSTSSANASSKSA
jgi:hypothetical protein